MSTAQTARPPAMPSRPRPPAQGGSPVGAGTAQIDPVRLFKKYKWVLLASLVLGAMLGVLGHFAWLVTAPIYESASIIQVEGPKVEQAKATEGYDERELERYMASQAMEMTGRDVLQRVVESPDLAVEAPRWASQFNSRGGVDTNKARRELEEIVRARVIPETQYIKLSVRWREPGDTYWLAKRVREEYFASLGARERGKNEEKIGALQSQIEDFRRSVTRLQGEREKLLRDVGVESVDTARAEERMALQFIHAQLTEVQQNLDALREMLQQLERDARDPAGIRYRDDMRAEAESLPIIQGLKNQIAYIEAEIRSQKNQGQLEGSMTVRRLRGMLEGTREQLNQQREIELEKLFAGRIEATRQAIATYGAQEVELAKRRDEYKERLKELHQVAVRVTDIDREIENSQGAEAELALELSNLRAIEKEASQRDIYDRPLLLTRIRTYQYERQEDRPVWPMIEAMVPLGVFIVGGIVGVVVVLRELLDQRVKSAQDVNLIPRTRTIGVVPFADSDPDKPKAIETAFRDHPTGVVAEHFRSIRTQVLNRMGEAGHRSLLVLASSPDSGATTAVLNLGLAIAAADRRVLIIDANLRRPAVHRQLGLRDQPGLTDVLAEASPLGAAIQESGQRNLDVLAVGSRENRQFERLGSDVMEQLLGQAAEAYDIVLIDAAPALVSGDGLALANRCDATMLVVKANSEKRGTVARLRNELEEGRGEFLGVLLNGLRHAAGGYMKRNIQVTHEYQKQTD